jgi:hypothetical protein
MKELKNAGARNKGKARGGKREPKKPKQNALEVDVSGISEDRDQPVWEFTASDLEALSLVHSIANLDAERAQICGVGVTCFF